jgi:hypothetical protein
MKKISEPVIFKISVHQPKLASKQPKSLVTLLGDRFTWFPRSFDSLCVRAPHTAVPLWARENPGSSGVEALKQQTIPQRII